MGCNEFDLCLDLLKKLVRVNTANPPGNERRAAETIALWLAPYGIRCDIVEVEKNRSNVVSKCLDEGPSVIFSGHLDVVPAGNGWESPPFEAVEKNGRIYGRGSSDMKGGIAAMVAASVWAMHQCHVRTHALAFVADEEVYGQGTKALLDTIDTQKTQFVVIGEPTSNQIQIAHRGAIRFKVSVYGRSCHASTPASGVNALENMSIVMEAIRMLNDEMGKIKHPLLPPPTMSCTMMNAGTKDNVIPANCEMIVDCRTGIADTAESFETAIRDKVSDLGGLQEGARLEMEPYINVPSGGVAYNSSIVDWARQAYRRSFSSEPIVMGFPACCDLSQFTSHGLQAILFGPGSIEQAHTVDEFIEISQLEQAFMFYCRCLME